jgi:hypothetical protein
MAVRLRPPSCPARRGHSWQGRITYPCPSAHSVFTLPFSTFNHLHPSIGVLRGLPIAMLTCCTLYSTPRRCPCSAAQPSRRQPTGRQLHFCDPVTGNSVGYGVPTMNATRHSSHALASRRADDVLLVCASIRSNVPMQYMVIPSMREPMAWWLLAIYLCLPSHVTSHPLLRFWFWFWFAIDVHCARQHCTIQRRRGRHSSGSHVAMWVRESRSGH